MLPKKKVTEEEIKTTEMRLAESYASLKQAIKNIPSEAARPVTDTVKEHPYVSVAAAAGAGYLAFRLLDQLVPRTKAITREASVQPELESKEAKGKEKRSLASRLLSEAVALAMPYITGYVRGEFSRLLAKPRESEEIASDTDKKSSVS